MRAGETPQTVLQVRYLSGGADKRMVLLLALFFGAALGLAQETETPGSPRHNALAVLFLFMVLGLTFSVSLYGMKKLIERSPKVVFGATRLTALPRIAHEVISF